jgi:hypothetical protein
MPWKAANCKAFLHFPANQVLLEMVKNQTPRLTGAAFFWAGVVSPFAYRRGGLVASASLSRPS